MDKPIYSLIAPAIRRDIYRDFYDSWAQTSIPFEVIFVGNVEPNEPMPDNFKYIYTNVKPVQCWEIAARNAIGEYLIPLQDDQRTIAPGLLDRVHNYVIRYPDEYIFAFMTKHRGNLVTWPSCFDKKIPLSPFVGQSGVYERKIWIKLGGLDRRFTYALSDIDMQMRFIETGKRLYIMTDCVLEELEPDHVRCCDSTSRHGRRTVNSFWVKENTARPGWENLAKNRQSGRYTVSKHRQCPVESFNDDNILLRNQGPEGNWVLKNKFYSLGANGDVIYTLPTIIAYGGNADLYFKKGYHFLTMRRLLELQPYINSVQLKNDSMGTRPGVDYVDLQKFRPINDAYWKTHRRLNQHLALTHLKVHNKTYDLTQPWLHNIEPNHVADIIINRSSRYRDELGLLAWELLIPYEDRCKFIGTKDEWNSFINNLNIDTFWFSQEFSNTKWSADSDTKPKPQIEFYETKDALDVAQVIKGCKLFIGNQSMPFTIAEAMKHPRCLENHHAVNINYPIGDHGYVKLTTELIEKYLNL